MNILKVYTLIFLLVHLATASIFAQVTIDLEGDYIASIPYNSVRIPSKGGTRIDIANDLKTQTTFTFRVRGTYTIHDRHVISALVAPLTIKSSGKLEEDVRYSKRTYPEGAAVDVTYKFNSYRLTYRYNFISTEKLIFGAGLTAKVREANITFRNAEGSSDYPDLGVVPLVNFFLHWKPTTMFGLLVEGDALGTNKGRAEDIFAGATVNLSKYFALKGGYRLLEGGANVTDNYNFTWVNYAAIGAIVSF